MGSPETAPPGRAKTPSAAGDSVHSAKGWKQFWIGAGLVTLLWSPWLVAWARFAWADELASYVLLIPVVAGSLFHKAMASAPRPTGRSLIPAILAWAGAAALLVAAWNSRGTSDLTRNDFLGPGILAYVLALVGCAFLTLGRAGVWHFAFPLGFLAFAAPLPSWAVNGLEIFFQHTSAEVAAWMMQVAQIPNLRSGLIFQLAGITIQVAQECSGIRSSLVLFIVSVYGGHIILRSPVRRWVLALFVIPLAIARNGFRIVTIAALCTHVSPRMIDSPIHHRGGPIFFALSLVPLFLLIYWLRRGEKKSGQSSAPDVQSTAAMKRTEAEI